MGHAAISIHKKRQAGRQTGRQADGVVLFKQLNSTAKHTATPWPTFLNRN